jgi:hypothetical protein
MQEALTNDRVHVEPYHSGQPDQRSRMEIEAHTGECKVELGKTKGEEDLKRLLGNLALLPGTPPLDQAANGASDSSASLITSHPLHGRNEEIPPLN